MRQAIAVRADVAQRDSGSRYTYCKGSFRSRANFLKLFCFILPLVRGRAAEGGRGSLTRHLESGPLLRRPIERCILFLVLRPQKKARKSSLSRPLEALLHA